MNKETDSVTEKNAREYDIHAKEWQATIITHAGHKYLEKPAIEKELPITLKDKNVLCIGVGSGEELESILKLNPTQVTGIDISVGLLRLAEAKFPTVQFYKMDMLDLKFPSSTFDLVYSSLTLHYAKDWDALCFEISRVLKPGGELLFSAHHPDFWSKKPSTGNSYTNDRGVTLTEHTYTLPGNVKVIYYNHPNLDSIYEAITYAGFKIKKSFTPPVIDITKLSLSAEDLESYERMRAKNSESPLFFIIKAIKNNAEMQTF